MAKSKYDQSHIIYDHLKEVFPDTISVGNCVNIRNCKSTNVDLADGWCVKCWDKGNDARRKIKITTEQLGEEKKSKLLLKERRQNIEKRQMAFYLANPSTRGRHRKGCQCEIHRPYKGVV